MHPLHSNNTQTIGIGSLKNLSANAKVEAGNIIKNTVKLKIDMTNNTLFLGVSGVIGDYSTSISINYPSVEAELTAPPICFTINQWEVELNLSVSFKGKFLQHPPPPPTNVYHFWEEAGIITLAAIGILGIVALIIFTGGVEALALAIVPLAETIEGIKLPFLYT